VSEPVAELNIRPFREGDLDCVLEIANSLSDAPHWPRSAYLAALGPEPTLRQPIPRRIALVAADEGPTPVHGFVVASLAPPDAELESIAVAGASQRRGVGRQLAEALTAELRKAGVARLYLEVRAGNGVAIALYRSLGFVEKGRRPRYYADPIEDAVLMELRFG
jgi:[ribosomal protein S18]-alanine N-acetyltransferase